MKQIIKVVLRDRQVDEKETSGNIGKSETRGRVSTHSMLVVNAKMKANNGI